MEADMSETKQTGALESQSVSSSIDAEKQVEEAPTEWTTVSILTAVGSFFSMFCSVGFVNAFGVFQEYYHSRMLSSYSNFDIIWIGSFMTFAMCMGAMPSGFLIDKLGARTVIGSGGVGILLGVFMTSLCRQYYQFFLAQAVLLGFSISFCTVPCIAVVSRRFSKHRGIIIGLVVAGSSTGGIVWPIVVNALLYTYNISFGWTMRIVGFAMMPLLALAAALIQDKKTPDATSKTPADSKTLADVSKTPSVAQPQPKEAKLAVVKNPAFQALVVGYGIYSLAFFAPYFFVSSYAVSIGKGTSFAFHLLSILNAASLVGRITMGFLADVYGPFNLTVVASITSSVVVFCWTTATSQAGIVVWSIAYGLTSGALLSLMPQCASRLATHQTYGTVMGIAMSLSAIAGLVGSPIAGELVPHGWLAVSMYCGACLMTGGIFMTIGRLSRSRSLLAKV